MNMLIVGNGFDLAHDRPTKYLHFLDFSRYVLRARNYPKTRKELENSLTDVSPTVKEYVLSSYDTRKLPNHGNKNPVVQEMYDCLDDNVWYEYFQKLYVENSLRGNNWIDFEGEIRDVIESIDRSMKDVYAPLPKTTTSILESCTERVACFLGKLKFDEYNEAAQKPSNYQNTYYDLIEKSYQDLQRLIRCLELYLDDCVKKMRVQVCSSDIEKLDIDFVLNFNYTEIPDYLYPSIAKATAHHIHGNADTQRSADKNNMVLGVNEYWEGSEKDSHTHFNLYKKFVQRIMKNTGIDYKERLEEVSDEYKRNDELLYGKVGFKELIYKRNCVYIFGHSLNVTDGDILREIIVTPGITIIIFYKDKQQQAAQIANLSKVLTQDTLLEYTFSSFPKIIFQQQTDMKPVENKDAVLIPV